MPPHGRPQPRRRSPAARDAEILDKFLALDICIEPHDRLLGLVVEVIEDGDIAPQRVLVAVGLQPDAVDLGRHVLELFLETLEPGLERAEQPAKEAFFLERCRIEVLGLEDDVGEQLPGIAEILVAHLAQDLVGVVGDRLLGAVAVDGNRGAVADVDGVGNPRNLGRFGNDCGQQGGFDWG